LVSIRLEENLFRTNGQETAYWLRFPGYDVKNRVDLEFLLREPLATLIAEYVHEHLLMLARGSNALWLFPGEDGRHKRSALLSMRPREKFSRMVGSEELVEAGLVLMQEARDAKSGPAWQARTFRNGLIIALLAVCPIRVGSFASLTLGRSFLRIDGGWWIRLAAKETKSGRPDERPVSGFLTSCVDEYLRTYRPRFLCASRIARARCDGAALGGAGPEMATGPLWMAQRGEAMSLVTMKKTITQPTCLTLGLPVNPHLFRACAATTAALDAGGHPRLASGLLQHVDPRVTDAHYNRASSLQAAIRYAAILDEMLCGRRD
jgi:integrase